MTRMKIRRNLARWLCPALLGLLACGADNPVNPGNPPSVVPPPVEPPPTTGSGFSVLTLLHGSQSGAADQTRDVAVDAQGNVYVTGGTADQNFPTTPNAYQRTFGRGQPLTSAGSGGNWDVFVMKFSADGQLIWSTLLGGGNYDRAYAIEVDGSGVYVAGRAGEGFPTTAGVVQAGFAGDDRASNLYGKQDGFIAKLSVDGSTLLWATYFGGPSDEFIRDVAVDPNGELYPAIANAKAAFPHITAGAYQPANRGLGDGAACRLAASATAVRWCTFIGGSGEDGNGPSLRLDGAGNVYFLHALSSTNASTTAGAYQAAGRGGSDMHLSKFTPQGAIVFSTYFGGSGNDAGETHNLWVTSSGEAYIGARTTSNDLPTTSGAFQPQLASGGDGFIARLSSDGRQLLSCTYLGGPGNDQVEGIGMDGSGNIVVSGTTSGVTIAGAAAAPLNYGGGEDGYIAVLTPNLGTVVRATFLGGSGADNGRTIAVDGPRNIIYTGGTTESTNFPTMVTAFLRQYAGRDAFLAGWRFQ